MKFSRHYTPLIIVALLMLPQITSAHLIGGQGLSSGVIHPFIGIDHLLAMVAVGILSSQLGHSGLWKIPMTFVGSMMAGGLVAMMGFGLPGTEFGIALSVTFLGLIIAFAPKFSLKQGMLLAGLFALFHGHAHGEEIPLITNAGLYAIGFVASTATLHTTGIFLGQLARKTRFTAGLLRFAGAGMSVIGLLLI